MSLSSGTESTSKLRKEISMKLAPNSYTALYPRGYNSSLKSLVCVIILLFDYAPGGGKMNNQ
jgi:hypothetical protein